jgi:hypothetical protein
MRIGVIRGDLPGPLYLQDLEPVSQFNPPTEPRGQELYLGRPSTTEIEAVLANPTYGAGAVIEGSDISGTFPITITGSNDDLKVRTTAAGAFTTVLIAQAAYANLTTFLAAINVALAGTGITARAGTGSGSRVAIESNTKGVNSVIGIDSTGNGSVANTPLGFGASAIQRTMPPASSFITASNPVNGTLNVSTATINGVGASTATNALTLIPSARGTTAKVADAIAPQIAETSVAIDSFLVGAISEYRSASFNPDSRRGLPSGAAISVVQDDGSTAFTAVAGLPTLSVADLNTPTTGALTLTGTFMGNYDNKDTKVRVTGPGINKTLYQKAIEAAGGSVSATSIVIPASLIPGATLTTTTARVQVRQRATAAVAMT